MIKPKFITRLLDGQQRDYITEANDQIRINGTIDPESDLYQNALDQYNANMLKGTTERLDVPVGFCGYIDPRTGRFRVEPEGLDSGLKSSTLYPDNIINPEDVPLVPITPYPIDECLMIGLPGSPEYSQGNCGIEDGDNQCSGISWFSAAGQYSECGKEVLNQSVCTIGGVGVNSNKGLANSNPIGGIGMDIPKHILAEADKMALSLYKSAGYRPELTSVGNLIGTILTMNFFFNVNHPDGNIGPEFWKEAGLRVSIGWDVRTGEIACKNSTLMWLYAGGLGGKVQALTIDYSKLWIMTIRGSFVFGSGIGHDLRIIDCGGPNDGFDLFVWDTKTKLAMRLFNRKINFLNASKGTIRNPDGPPDHWLQSGALSPAITSGEHTIVIRSFPPVLSSVGVVDVTYNGSLVMYSQWKLTGGSVPVTTSITHHGLRGTVEIQYP